MNIWILATLATVFYPEVAPKWSTGPLTGDRFAVPAAETRIADSTITGLARLYRRLPAPALRAQLAADLSRANNPAAVPALLNCLQTEQAPAARAALVTALRKLSDAKQWPAGQQLRLDYAAAPTAVERAEALTLLIRHGGEKPAAVLEYLAQEPAGWVVTRGFDELPELPPELLKGDWKPATEEFHLALLTRRAAAGLAGDFPESPLWRRPEFRAAAARGAVRNPEASPTLADKLAEAPEPGVRREFAPGAERHFAKLGSDPAVGVRRATALGLGNRRSAAAAETLLKLLIDRDVTVRRAAADSLRRVAPPKPVRDRILNAAREFPFARPEIVAVFAGLGDAAYGPALAGLLPEASAPELAAALIDLLGDLRTRSAAAQIAGYGIAKDAIVRQAAATALGKLDVPETDGALRQLAIDRIPAVRLAALRSIWSLKRGVFRPELEKNLGARNMDFGEHRAIAIRTLFAQGPLPGSAVGNLRQLATRPCIPVPMSPPMFDQDNVRISALLALKLDGARGNATAARAYTECRKLLGEPNPNSMNDAMPPGLAEFLRQLDAADRGETVKPAAIPDFEPELRVAPLREHRTGERSE